MKKIYQEKQDILLMKREFTCHRSLIPSPRRRYRVWYRLIQVVQIWTVRFGKTLGIGVVQGKGTLNLKKNDMDNDYNNIFVTNSLILRALWNQSLLNTLEPAKTTSLSTLLFAQNNRMDRWNDGQPKSSTSPTFKNGINRNPL